MRPFAVLLVLLAMLSASAAKDKFDAAEFVQQHLNSIGTADARAAIKDCVAQGTVTFEVVNRGPLTWQGPAVLVSEGDELASQMKFPPTVYRTEWFVSDGKKTSVAQVIPGRWTDFGTFIRTHNEILTEGLWGGTLSTAWALSHLDERRARLEDRGIKKIDGVELHRVDYTPKKNSDLEIQLYFEPDTNRHVMTIYSMTVVAGIGMSASQSVNQHEARYELQEQFGDFKTVDNVTVPTHWKIQFTHGNAAEGNIDQYDITETNIRHNISVDPKNFEMK
jgi:hypothetical protein